MKDTGRDETEKERLAFRREDSEVTGHPGTGSELRETKTETEMVTLRMVKRVPQREKVNPNDRQR